MQLSKSHRAALVAASARRWERWRSRHPDTGKPRAKITIFEEDLAPLEKLSESRAAAVRALLDASRLLEWRWDAATMAYKGFLPEGGAR